MDPLSGLTGFCGDIKEAAVFFDDRGERSPKPVAIYRIFLIEIYETIDHDVYSNILAPFCAIIQIQEIVSQNSP